MGHNLLGVLPRTKRWSEVVSRLEDGGTTASVATAGIRAAETQFLRASRDPVFVEAVRILLSVPLAARDEKFGEALRDADIPVSGDPELLDLLTAATVRLDEVRSGASNTSDMGELAGRALISTLSRAIGGALPGLFEATPEDVRARTRQLSWSKGISELSRQFFGELMAETLSYWLDRTLATHVGTGLRFEDVASRNAFDVDMRSYTMNITRIIQEFSGGWYGKTLHKKGFFGSGEAAEFGAVALKKIVSELKRDYVIDA
ncbi:hypothetical protein [Sedimentitalea arenosa]|uniref:Uncharacterized protein n=1 Tax=Sedimentitalea arenosa TaxID=2798803 RepID=A0A8J7LRE8_9RHOB|nr:hypothetical protein [Arenibacterium arenosum]MBJ6370779.1 hypothetical protein [Arenibacterium arenosum]